MSGAHSVPGRSWVFPFVTVWVDAELVAVTFIIAGGGDQPVLVLNFLVSTRPVSWQGCSVAKSSLGPVNIDEQGRPGRNPYFSHLSDA